MARASTVSRLSVRFGAGALACVLALAAAGCSSGGDKKDAASPPAPQVQGVQDKRKPLVVGKVQIETAGAPAKLGTKLRAQMLRAAQTYVDTAVHDPLTTGKVGAGYEKLFEKGLRVTATGRDMKALTDESLGQATRYVETAKPVKISGLADASGTLLLLATNLSLKVKAAVGSGDVTVNRDVELTFDKLGDNWVVTAYRVKAIRKAPKKATTTTTAEANGKSNP